MVCSSTSSIAKVYLSDRLGSTVAFIIIIIKVFIV